MDKRSDIWFYLRDHQTPPPSELKQRLLESLAGHCVLQRLQNEETTPPAFLRESITGILYPSKPGQSRIIGHGWQFFRTKRIYGSIAASFLLLLTGVTFYTTLLTRKANAPKGNGIVQSGPIVFVPAADSLRSRDTSQTATAISSGSLPAAATDSTITVAVAKHERNWTLRIEGHSVRLVDNDPLFTFTSYHYPEIGSFLEQKTDEEIKINVDQYTNIVISKQAAVMIREMYKTRSNGTPTRKARKMKERLEHWKQADEKYFDGAGNFNPADPVDLAEFIFK